MTWTPNPVERPREQSSSRGDAPPAGLAAWSIRYVSGGCGEWGEWESPITSTLVGSRMGRILARSKPAVGIDLELSGSREPTWRYSLGIRTRKGRHDPELTHERVWRSASGLGTFLIDRLTSISNHSPRA